MKTRIYTIRERKTGQVVKLVRASHPNTSIAYMARAEWEARPATATDVEQAMNAGMKVEETKQEQLSLEV